MSVTFTVTKVGTCTCKWFSSHVISAWSSPWLKMSSIPTILIHCFAWRLSIGNCKSPAFQYRPSALKSYCLLAKFNNDSSIVNKDIPKMIQYPKANVHFLQTFDCSSSLLSSSLRSLPALFTCFIAIQNDTKKRPVAFRIVHIRLFLSYKRRQLPQKLAAVYPLYTWRICQCYWLLQLSQFEKFVSYINSTSYRPSNTKTGNDIQETCWEESIK